MMRRFIGKLWSSSQATINVEGEESEVSVDGKFVVLCWNVGVGLGSLVD
jgi:hypothetical protein